MYEAQFEVVGVASDWEMRSEEGPITSNSSDALLSADEYGMTYW
jgi:hypothetical protein